MTQEYMTLHTIETLKVENSSVDISVAAATAVVGYDLCTNVAEARVGWSRFLTGIGMAGSAAAGDTKVIGFVNGVRFGTFYNKATGFPTNDHMISQAVPVPANAQVQLIVEDAPATNPINVTMQFAP